MLEIALSVGARFTSFTVIVSDLLSVAIPSVTEIVADAVPESEKPGASARFPVAVPVPGAVVVTVA